MMRLGYKEIFLLLIFLLCLPLAAFAEYGLNMPRGATEFSQNVYGLHMIIFWVCVVIAVLVFGAMIISMVRDRKSKGVVPQQFSHSTKVEVIWTVVPIIILVVMAWPATKSLIEMEDPEEMEMTIKITGYQWLWKYDYKDEGISIVSRLDNESNYARQLNSGINPNTVDNYLLNVDNPLVIPVNTNIRFLLTADDVIHSWWVPDFGWKRDAIPWFVNQAWTNVKKTGVYRGQCAELCGKDHGFMPIVVEVKTKEDYAAWVREQKGEQAVEAEKLEKDWSHDDLMARGENVYSGNCATCHKPDGTGMPPAFPALTGSELLNGNVDAQIDLILHGREGTAMLGFDGRLSEADVAAVITYTRNAFGDVSVDGESIQPSVVKRIKSKEEDS